MRVVRVVRPVGAVRVATSVGALGAVGVGCEGLWQLRKLCELRAERGL